MRKVIEHFFYHAGPNLTMNAFSQPTFSVVYAETFPEDQVSAFSHYRLWESLGYILIFSMKLARVDVAVIIYIVVTTLAAGNLLSKHIDPDLETIFYYELSIPLYCLISQFARTNIMVFIGCFIKMCKCTTQ